VEENKLKGNEGCKSLLARTGFPLVGWILRIVSKGTFGAFFMNNEIDFNYKSTMTIKELSNSMDVPVRTVHSAVNRVLPGIQTNGKTTYMDLEQVAIISKEIKRAHNVDLASTRKVATTDLELLNRSKDLLVDLVTRVNQLTKENKEMKPKAIIHDKILNSEGSILPSDAGKIIMGHPNQFTKWCRELGILFKRGDYGSLRPNARYQSKGYLTIKPILNVKQNKTYDQVYFTPEGLIWITEKWNKLHPFQLESV
jgi:phage antirepressor YoqD-like protein